MNLTDYEFFHKLSILPFIEEIWLYGSRARGDYREKSDIDIAILCPQATSEQWQEVLDIIDCADTLLELDAVRYDILADDDSLKHNILKDKKVIYMKSYPRWIETYRSLGEALERFHEIIEEPEDKNSYVKDATIQRFEFCIELSWKLFKKIGESEGMEIPTPKAALKAAFSMKFIKEETIWLNMMEDRNITSHTYRESLAKEVYLRVRHYHDAMKDAHEKVGERYGLISI